MWKIHLNLFALRYFILSLLARTPGDRRVWFHLAVSEPCRAVAASCPPPCPRSRSRWVGSRTATPPPRAPPTPLATSGELDFVLILFNPPFICIFSSQGETQTPPPTRILTPRLRKDRLHQVVFPGEYWSPFVSRCWWLKMAKLSGFRTSWRSVPLNQVGREPAKILQMQYLSDFSKHTA